MSGLSVGQEIGQKFVGPIVFTYVNWILQNAIKQKIQVLYFMARDGYLMYQAAKILQAKYNNYGQIECYYFFSSRKSLRLPYLATMTIDDAVERIFEYEDINDIEQLEDILNLSQKEKNLFHNLLINELEVESYNLKELILNSKKVKQQFSKILNNTYNVFFAYLEQIGMFKKKKKAIVDSGWLGNTQKQLYEILKFGGHSEIIIGFYFGLYKNPYEKEPGLSYHTFYFSPNNHLWRKMKFSNNVFEVVCSANHGQTIGYRIDQGIVCPVLDNYLYSEEKRQIQEGSLCKVQIVSLKKLEKLLSMLLYHPNKVNADYLGKIKFSEKKKDLLAEELAPQLSKCEALELLIPLRLIKYTKRKNKVFSWAAGSVIRSDLRGKSFFLLNCAIWEAIRLLLKF